MTSKGEEIIEDPGSFKAEKRRLGAKLKNS